MHALLLAAALLPRGSALAGVDPSPSIWLARPASNWNEALPVGNGRLGAMIFGGVARERIQINEESLWAGEPVEAWPEDFPGSLAEVRRLVFAGRNAEAEAWGVKHLTATPTSYRSYEPLGDLWLEFGGDEACSGYRRELLLADGLARVSLRRGDATITREVFVSAPDDVLVIRITTDRPGTRSPERVLSTPVLLSCWRRSLSQTALLPMHSPSTMCGFLTPPDRKSLRGNYGPSTHLIPRSRTCSNGRRSGFSRSNC